MSPLYSSIVLPLAAAVPSSVGVLLAVMPSPTTPVSLLSLIAITGSVAVALYATFKAALLAETLPAASVCLALKVLSAARSAVNAKSHEPLAVTWVVPSNVLPLNTCTVAPASP